jgi:carboxypeptidase Taq
MQAYEELERRFARYYKLAEAMGVLHWDRAAMMPSGGAEGRAEQIATLQVLMHEQLIDPAIGELLERVDDDGLDEWQRANIAEMKRKRVHATAVPAALVDAESRATSRCEMVWREARRDDDFERLAPHLAEVVNVVRQVAEAKAEALGCSPYDALLDQFDPAMRAETIDPIFDRLAAFLPDLIDDVLAHQSETPDPIFPEGPFPESIQKALSHQFMERLGFDFRHGRLDTSAHAFCGGTTDDVRLTTNYDESDFTRSLMATMHETGHALYSLGLPTKWRYQPVGHARGMSMHESQSLLVEMQVCRSREFLEWAAPHVREAFGAGSVDKASSVNKTSKAAQAWTPENLYRLSTRVERSLIRIDADEVTYPAHVILRYRLERQLIAGELDVEQLPEAWNAAMVELVGIEPPDDRDGCMQDIHWVSGGFGYFPTYTLGAMTAAQLFDAATRQEPGIVSSIQEGDFAPLLGWLRENIHQKGSSLTTQGLIEEATGRGLDAAVFEKHLRERYLG